MHRPAPGHQPVLAPGTARAAVTVGVDDVRRALDDPEQPRLVFQPIVDLHRGVVAGYECLARFTGPPDASPDVWFAAADRAGLGARLEARSIRAALLSRRTVPRSCFIAVNVSPHLIVAPEVQAAFAAADDLTGVVVELTEHTPAYDESRLSAALDVLRSRRAHIAIDDAGSGYAGLQQLLTVRPQLVKLDRALVDRIDQDEIKRSVAEMLGGVAGRMDSWLLAEGIERGEELEAAIAMGVPLGQGWLLGRPDSGWQGVHPDMATRIRLLAFQRSRPDSVASLIQPGSRCDDGGARSGSAVNVSGWTVTLDVDECPVTLSHPMLGAGERPVSIRISPTADVESVIFRALARDPAHRFDPLVAVDDSGRYVGLVPMERLVAALARLRSTG